LLPEEIFGTEEVPEYIFSDSSEEEENATPEQRANHQLHRRRTAAFGTWSTTCRISPLTATPNANTA
jgi:hypothetical protein